MGHESVIDKATGRKFYLDAPDDAAGRPLTFLLNLHGGGSFGAWQHRYFPAHDYADAHGLVVATPTAARRSRPGTGSRRPMTSTCAAWSTWSWSGSARTASFRSGWSATRRAA
ncbi:MAG TPA: hypothetical protein VK599_23125 [Streptosporangiaceae bacterium]|nr:hypothetical protein [Streptosporangiaceae bacterium]